jgi:two-component system, sensor histidine kinase YesM
MRKPKRRRKNIPPTSLFFKLMILTFFVIALPMLIFGRFSMSTVKNILESRFESEQNSDTSLVIQTIDSFTKILVYTTADLYNDDEIKDIVKIMEKGTNDITEAERLAINLRFVNRLKKTLSNEALYILDMMIYATLIVGDNYICNYSTTDEEMAMFIKACRSGPYKNPNVIRWIGNTPKIFDTYNSKNKYSVTIGKGVGDNIELNQEVEALPMLYISIDESYLAKKLFGEDFKNIRFLVNENMQVISSNKKDMIGQTISQAVKLDQMLGEKGRFTTGFPEVGKVSVGYERLFATPWTLVDVRSYEQIIQEIESENYRLIVQNLLFIGLFLIIAWLIVSRITEPLRALALRMVNIPVTEPFREEEIPTRAGREIRQIYRSYGVALLNINELIAKVQEEEKRKHELELAALQAQIKPHFLFNTLMSIRSATMNDKKEKSAKMILALSTFLRNSIIRPNEVISLYKEIEIIKTYLEIEDMRSYQSISLLVDIQDEFLDYNVPKLLLQPLIENAIVHGFHKQEEGVIQITGKRDKSFFILEIRDNGCGFTENPLEAFDSNEEDVDMKKSNINFGVYSVLQRIHLYYGDEFGMEYINDNGTIIRLRLPIQSQYLSDE